MSILENRLEHLSNHPTASSGWIYLFDKPPLSNARSPKLPATDIPQELSSFQRLLQETEGEKIEWGRDQNSKAGVRVSLFQKTGSWTSWDERMKDDTTAWSRLLTRVPSGGTRFHRLKQYFQGTCCLQHKNAAGASGKQLSGLLFVRNSTFRLSTGCRPYGSLTSAEWYVACYGSLCRDLLKAHDCG